VSSAQSRLNELSADRTLRDPAMQEIQRIVQLGLWTEPTAEEVEEFCRSNVLASAFERGFRLFPAQAGAVMAYDLFDGGFYPIGVGFGKTLISLMIAERAYAKGLRKTLLFVPPQVYPQLVERDIPWARRHVPLSVPFHKLGGTSQRKRLAHARSQQEGCYILPYSCLSTTDSEQLLEMIEAKLVIADEAHLLKNAKAARTRRVRRFLDKFQPEMVAMSGTITSKSILDYWHLIRACLGDNSPLPNNSHLVRQWAGVVDADPRAIQDFDRPGVDRIGDFRTEPIMPLVFWAKRHWPTEELPETVRGFRRAYKLRLSTAPGVVVTGDASIGTSLVLHNAPVKTSPQPDGWMELQALIEQVQKEWTAPNGDEIDHAIHQFGWLYQLSAGWYNDLYWPEPEVLATERGIPLEAAVDLLDRALEHHALLQLYHSTLRRWLGAHSRPMLDTPFLVAADMDRHGAKNVGPDLYEAWSSARAADFEGRPERRARPVRVCGYKVRAAVEWARKLRPGTGAIVWVHHKEIGLWVFEALKAAGVDAVHAPAGRNEEIIDPANGGKVFVASINAHGTGKNLQHFEHQYVVQWPRAANIAEQMLGRLHRSGQKADELIVVTNNTTTIDEMNFAACLNDACYIHDTTVRQKLMYAAFDPPPVIYSVAFLRKHGLDPKKLTGEQMKLLEDKFGHEEAA
jgi:hypothetical protein